MINDVFKAKDVQKTVQAEIERMTSARAKELQDVEQKIAAAQAEAEKQTAAMDAATTAMNQEAYTAAKRARLVAMDQAEMLMSYRKKLEEQGLITEADSAKVIQALLKYEDALGTDYEKACSEHIIKLAALTKDYRAAIAATEWTLTDWLRRIHKNYREDPWNPDSALLDKPKQMRLTQYTGVTLAANIATIFDKPGAQPILAKAAEGKK